MEEQLHGISKLNDLVKEIKICMLITHDNEMLRGRPMATTEAGTDGHLWFFTSSSTAKYDEILRESKVALSYSDPLHNTYVMVNGEAEISRDKELINKFWNPMLKAWFPDGPDDPHITLIKIKPVDAEYWDNTSSKMIQFFNMLKAIGSGKEYEEGEHGKISL
jgi:general stress protein 26